MGRQFQKVSAQYGAPMGRHCVGDLGCEPRSIQLFKVELDSGGYDDGGAYWGIGGSDGYLWAARNIEGDLQTVRAWSRESAAFKLGIGSLALARRLKGWREYGLALLDKRAPMPAGMDRADVIAWMQDCGANMGQQS